MSKPLLFFPHWSYKIPEKTFKEFECVGFHMTDLPFGRGGTPLQNLILLGKKKTMISAFRVENGMDVGAIYLKRSLSLDGSAGEIYKRAGEIILNEMIPFIVEHRPVPIKQKGRIVLFKRRTPRESEIKGIKSLPKLYDFVRMLDAPNYPKAFLKKDKFVFDFSNAILKEGVIYANVQIHT